MKLIIRIATMEDGETIGAFQIACAKESENRDLSPREVEAGVCSILSLMGTPAARGEYIVVEDEGNKIVGCSLLQLQFSDWKCGLYLNVESVYVLPEYRGKGILQDMMEYIEDGARKMGQVCEIRLCVAETNIPMHWALEKVNITKSKYVIFSKIL